MINCVTCSARGDDVTHSVENGPGFFCFECWKKLENHFNPMSQKKTDSPVHTLTEPIKAFLIPGSRPELKGLEVLFDAKGHVGLRTAADHNLGFILSPEAAFTLAELIVSQFKTETFCLATSFETEESNG